MTPPTLTGQRVRLRAHQAADWDAVTALWAHPDVVRHISGVPSTATESWGRILRYRGLWLLLGYGYWAVEDRATGQYLGDLGFADFKRATDPAYHGIAEAGWAFHPSAHGKGFATEALTLALDWARDHVKPSPEFGGVSVVAIIADANAASVRLAERVGFTRRQMLKMRDEEVPLYGWG